MCRNNRVVFRDCRGVCIETVDLLLPVGPISCQFSLMLQFLSSRFILPNNPTCRLAFNIRVYPTKVPTFLDFSMYALMVFFSKHVQFIWEEMHVCSNDCYSEIWIC